MPRFKYDRKQTKVWTDENVYLLQRLLYQTNDLYEIAKFFNCSYGAVTHAIRYYKLERVNRSHIYKLQPLTEAERGYVAGIFDGEGCLFIGKRTNGRYYPMLSVSNTQPEMLSFLKDKLGGEILYNKDRKRKCNKRRNCFLWYAKIYTIEKILLEIINYLVIKKDQAHILLDFVRTFPHINSKKYFEVPQDIINKRERLFLQMYKVQHRNYFSLTEYEEMEYDPNKLQPDYSHTRKVSTT